MIHHISGKSNKLSFCYLALAFSGYIDYNKIHLSVLLSMIVLSWLSPRLPLKGAAERSEAEGYTPPTSLTLGYLP